MRLTDLASILLMSPPTTAQPVPIVGGDCIVLYISLDPFDDLCPSQDFLKTSNKHANLFQFFLKGLLVTENTMDNAANLFIRRWGEMGATWGISRTMAELHALLFLATEPLCTDDVIDRLAISRGSASMNLRELVNWGLVERIHRRGDRKEYFQAEKDVWQMFETISRERRRREVLPIKETIERCLTMIDNHHGDSKTSITLNAKVYRQRFQDIHEFCEMFDTLFDVIARGGRKGVKPFLTTIAQLVS